jgi:hypothetical protein
MVPVAHYSTDSILMNFNLYAAEPVMLQAPAILWVKLYHVCPKIKYLSAFKLAGYILYRSIMNKMN